MGVMVEDFDAWYVDARSSLAPALSAWCGDPAIGADAIDEAFVRCFEHWAHVRSLTSPEGWVWRTAMNVVRRRVRRARMEERLLRRRAAGADDWISGPTGADIDLRRALLTLTERQRSAVVLFYIADLPASEVAEILGVATGTVGATLHQARALLNARLDPSTADLVGETFAADGGTTDGALP
jgi:RNA polymerase sigma-70 factor (ECF subfamily)